MTALLRVVKTSMLIMTIRVLGLDRLVCYRHEEKRQVKCFLLWLVVVSRLLPHTVKQQLSMKPNEEHWLDGCRNATDRKKEKIRKPKTLRVPKGWLSFGWR